ncbi:aspartyl protease family protein [Tundrisphaera lichenicola]|uniref:aspartyl protease family protein n=1 Tax=Tundrisphaera lichenicola TaxID=2029860 RepID=UPI003EB7C9AA
MTERAFQQHKGPILVEVQLTGPSGSTSLDLVLDTGATTSLIKRSALIYLGFDPDQSTRRVQMTTGSAVETVPVVVLTRLSALGQHRFGFPVIAHALPSNALVDGLLGLDFLRGLELTIDFRAGRIRLA